MMILLRLIFLILASALSAIGCGEFLIKKFGMAALGGYEYSLWNDVLVTLFVVVSATLIIRNKIAKNTRNTLRDASLSVMAFYVACRFLHDDLLIPTAICPVLRYADVAFAIPAIVLLKTFINEGYKPRLKQHGTEILADSNDEEDVLSRKAEADALAMRLIRNKNTETSIAVSITGVWGLGKTYFLHLLKYKLEAEHQTVFFFNPWFCNNDDVVAMFFDELENHIQGEEQSRVIRRYARLLGKDSGDSLTAYAMANHYLRGRKDRKNYWPAIPVNISCSWMIVTDLIRKNSKNRSV